MTDRDVLALKCHPVNGTCNPPDARLHRWVNNTAHVATTTGNVCVNECVHGAL